MDHLQFDVIHIDWLVVVLASRSTLASAIVLAVRSHLHVVHSVVHVCV